MLKRISISGFKSIFDLKDLDLGRVNLFIGGNGSGKSNILEALGILSASLREVSDIELQKRGVRLSRPALFKSAFKNTKLRADLSISAIFENSVEYNVSIRAGDASDNLKIFSESIRHAGKLYMGRSPNGITVEGISKPKQEIDPGSGIWDRFRDSVGELPVELGRELERMARFAIYAPQTAFLRGTDTESLPTKPIGLSGGGLPQATRAVMQRFRNKDIHGLFTEITDLVWLPGWANYFSVEGYDPSRVPAAVKAGDAMLYFKDRYMKTNRNFLSAYDSSEGTLYLLFIAVLILHTEAPKIFALDNVDNALNPLMTTRLLEKLILATCGEDFRKHSIGPDQIFLTSHNPTALDAFDLFDDEQRVFVVARNDLGHTTVTRLQPGAGWTRDDWVKAAGGKSLSELWIEGKIKGALGL